MKSMNLAISEIISTNDIVEVDDEWDQQIREDTKGKLKEMAKKALKEHAAGQTTLL